MMTIEEIKKLKTPYECVVYAKELLRDIEFDSDGLCIMYTYIHRVKHYNVKLATAIATVMGLATFNYDHPVLVMSLPATRDCLDSFKYFGKLVDKCKPIYITYYDCAGENIVGLAYNSVIVKEA